MARGTTGNYYILNREKYIYPNVSKIQYRSTWEARFAHYVDRNSNVIRWGYECIRIPYLWQIDNKVHNYYPDFYVEFSNGLKVIVEIKPEKEGKRGKSLYENLTYSKNYDKWTTAKKFCDEMGYKFLVVTEKELFNKLR